jgi:CO dehydrogenase maturation factor
VVGDLPGGTRQPFFGWAGFASLVLVVAEPTAKGLLSARRLERLALLESPPRLLVVASKVRSDADVARVVEATGLAVAAAVPLDEAVVDAERAGRPVVEASPRSPAVEAIRLLVDELGEDGL